MGIRASSTTELVFQDCRIPKGTLLGKEGMGSIVAINTLNYSRPGVGAQALGHCRGRARRRGQVFARTHPVRRSRFPRSRRYSTCSPTWPRRSRPRARCSYATARTIDAGEKKFAKESAMTKLFCSDVAMKVTVDALQVMGGYGYMREYPDGKADARREDHPDLRRNKPDPAQRNRVGADQGRIGLSVTEMGSLAFCRTCDPSKQSLWCEQNTRPPINASLQL